MTSFSAGSPVVVFLYGYTGDSPLPATVSVSIDGTPDYQDAYQYDAAGRVLSIHRTGQADGNAVADVSADFTYTPSGQFQSITRALDGQTAVTASYAYDTSGNLTGLTYTSPSSGEGSPLTSPLPPTGEGPGVRADGILSSYAYTYDAAGRIIEATTPDGTIHYTYDPTGQLTGAYYDEGSGFGVPGSEFDVQDSGSVTTEDAEDTEGTTPVASPQSPVPSPESFSYDPNGNRTNLGYVIGADNQLLSDGTHWYSYDAEGNRTARFVWTDTDADGEIDSGEKSQITEYAWDARNRLVSVTDKTASGEITQTVTYVYDVENRLIEETVLADGVARSTFFAYQGGQIALQFASSSPLPQGEGQGEGSAVTLTHRYLWGPAVDQILADEQLPPQAEDGRTTQPGNVVLPLTDNLGTVRDLALYDVTTDTTTVVTHRTFSAFGERLSQTSTAAVDCVFGFTGRLYDEATGLQNNLNRWYDAKTGGWISKDPIGFTAGDANTGRYCGSSPTAFLDPTGLAEAPDRLTQLREKLESLITGLLQTLKRHWKKGGFGV